jgi:hypothetical protein
MTRLNLTKFPNPLYSLYSDSVNSVVNPFRPKLSESWHLSVDATSHGVVLTEMQQRRDLDVAFPARDEPPRSSKVLTARTRCSVYQCAGLENVTGTLVATATLPLLSVS